MVIEYLEMLVNFKTDLKVWIISKSVVFLLGSVLKHFFCWKLLLVRVILTRTVKMEKKNPSETRKVMGIQWL